MHSVSWGKICQPKDKGGLGLKTVIAEAAQSRQVLFIASRRKSLWNDWADSKYVEKCYWDMKVSDSSWCWRCILSRKKKMLWSSNFL